MPAAVGQTPLPQHQAGQFWVKTKPGFELPAYNLYSQPDAAFDSSWQQLNRLLKISVVKKPFKTPDSEVQRIYKVYFAATTTPATAASMASKLAGVEWAEPCGVFLTSALPNDPDTAKSWFFGLLQAAEAWNLKGQSTCTIAIVDDAINTDHPDLASNIFTNVAEIPGNGKDDDLNGFVDDVHGYDVASGDTDVRPPASLSLLMMHGTHTSGIAGGVTDNGTGLASISHNTTKILPVKASTLPIALTHVEEGVDYAVLMKPDVLSMSFGTADSTIVSTIKTLLEAARKQGTVCVAAAGNDGQDLPTYPAAFGHVIAVGSVKKGDTIAKTSNYGSWVDVMAPGDSIYSTLPGPTTLYGYQSGTSMATPLVAGLLGLMRSANPALNNLQLEQCLKFSCQNIDDKNPARQGKTGAGRINALLAMECAGRNNVNNAVAGMHFSVIYQGGGIFNILLPKDTRHASLIVTDMTGKQLYHSSLPGSSLLALPLPAGFYVFWVHADNQHGATKVALADGQ